MSRVVDRRRVFDDGEKELFRKTLRAVEGFSGAQVLTWVVLENHFHILLHLPERQDVADAELIRRLLFLYDKTLVGNLAAYLATLRASGQDEAAAQKVLDVRKEFPEATLADLYDPVAMPPKLVKAHAELDRAVDRCYRAEVFPSDRHRVEFLFAQYEQLTAPLVAKRKTPSRKITLPVRL